MFLEKSLILRIIRNYYDVPTYEYPDLSSPGEAVDNRLECKTRSQLINFFENTDCSPSETTISQMDGTQWFLAFWHIFSVSFRLFSYYHNYNLYDIDYVYIRNLIVITIIDMSYLIDEYIKRLTTEVFMDSERYTSWLDSCGQLLAPAVCVVRTHFSKAMARIIIRVRLYRSRNSSYTKSCFILSY